MERRYRFAALLGGLLAACATQNSDDPETAQDLFIQNYTTPDPGNPWLKASQVSGLQIGQENVLPGEEALFKGYAERVKAMQHRLQGVNHKVARGFHAKSHGCVEGKLHVHVPDALADAKVGLFADNSKTFPTWIRFSNGTGFVQGDGKGDVRGLAMKVMKVPGAKLLAGHEGAGTQDILMTNGATTPASDAARFVDFGEALTNGRVSATGEDVNVIAGLLKLGGWLTKSENTRVRQYLEARALPRILVKGNLLGEQFWSGGAIAMGLGQGSDPMTAPAPKAAKLTAVTGIYESGVDSRGAAYEKCTPTNQLPALLEKNYLRDNLRSRMQAHDTCIDLRIQFQKDATKQFIEDTSVEWKEDDTGKPVSIAMIVIPTQDGTHDLTADESTPKEAFCNDLSFTPWHTLPVHRPLGNIMRARKPVYQASSDERGASAEPTGDETF